MRFLPGSCSSAKATASSPQPTRSPSRSAPMHHARRAAPADDLGAEQLERLAAEERVGRRPGIAAAHQIAHRRARRAAKSTRPVSLVSIGAIVASRRPASSALERARFELAPSPRRAARRRAAPAACAAARRSPTRRWRSARLPSMSPVSMPTSICISVTPVSRSPRMIAHWIGAAPRYFGRSDACTFRQPCFGASPAPRAAGSCRRRRRRRRRARARAARPTKRRRCAPMRLHHRHAGGERAHLDRRRRDAPRPRPAGLSGCVTTATTFSVREERIEAGHGELGRAHEDDAELGMRANLAEIGPGIRKRCAIRRAHWSSASTRCASSSTSPISTSASDSSWRSGSANRVRSELALEPLEGARHFVRRGVAAEAEDGEVVAVLHLRALGEHALFVDGAVGIAIARPLARPRPPATVERIRRRIAVRRGHQRRHRAHADAAAASSLARRVARADGDERPRRPRTAPARRAAAPTAPSGTSRRASARRR